MDINRMRDNLHQISSGNIVRLISDVLLHNIDKIDNYQEHQAYYQDDVVYIYSQPEDKHKLFRCLVNETIPGPFKATDWEEYVFRFDDRRVFLDSEFTATVDNTYTCSINQPLYDYLKDTLHVFHPIRGRLVQGKHWRLSDNKQAVILIDFSLYKNETLVFEVVK
jgi:hypothetical protein